MTEIPEDLRHLRGFPQYDATFQDHPHFRENLERWADKTEKLAAGLTSLAESFDKFHETGLLHFQAATSVIQNLQNIAGLCQNDSGSTLTSHLLMFVESLNKIWCYYEAFLGQTQMLNTEPIRDLANTFTGVKKLHEQLLQYRREHLSAAEKLCACKHSSRLTDKSLLSSLTETCYTSQKTYQLVLSKFVISLRETHTIDMMSFMRRMIEHLLSKYSYHNYCTEVLKELEPQVSDLFTKTKNWRSFYEREMKLWRRLHFSVNKNVMAEYQRNMSAVPTLGEATPTWSDMALAPITAGKHMMKPLLRMFPSPKDLKQAPAVQPEVVDWELDGSVEGLPRRATYTHPGEEHPPVLRRDLVEERKTKEPISRDMRHQRRKLVRSMSNPDLLSEALDLQGSSGSNGSVAGDKMADLPHSSSHSPLVVTFNENTTESAADAMEVFLQRSASHSVSSPLRPLAAVLSKARNRRKNALKGKKGRKQFASLDDMILPEEPSVRETPEDGGGGGGGGGGEGSGPSSPATGRKGSQSNAGFFRKARGSFLHHLMSHEKQATPPADFHEGPGEGSDTQSVEELSLNGEGTESRRKKKKKHSSPDINRHQPRPFISSPLPRESSGGELRNEDLRSLVLPVPKTWSMCGYLWLRMRTQNNRYAWTHIFCVVDSVRGELMVQEQDQPEPQCLENLLLCNTKLCTPEFIDRNYCFRVISPTSEHLFQALSCQEQQMWVAVLQDTTARALKQSPRHPPLRIEEEGEEGGRGSVVVGGSEECEVEEVPDAMSLILGVPGNRSCADCSSTVVEWASLNLGIVLCIECSGIHRSLGVHVSKVRSLNLDKWDRPTVDFMLRQGNKKANCYYEATLGSSLHEITKKPAASASKEERSQFIQQKYIALAFVPPYAERTSPC